MNMITVEDLYIRYGREGDMVLNGLSFQVKKGEFLAVVGPADAGKSTLCRALSGLIPHSYNVGISGTINVGGIDVRKSDVATISKKLRYIFEEPSSQFVGMSVEEEITFSLETLDISREEMEERVNWALDLVRMTPYRYKSPTELSGGQMQRVTIASALASKPEILVLDEPTAELDPIGKAEVFEVISRLSKESNLTILLVDQHSEEIIKYADRVMLIANGKIICENNPREFYKDTKLLKEMGVSIPPVITLGQELGKRFPGVSVPFTIEEAESTILGLLGPDKTFSPQDSSISSQTVKEGAKVLEVDNITYKYPDGTPALNGISFDVHKGEFLAIIGENGAGKSTLVKHFNGLLCPTTGQVIVNGKPTTDYSTVEMAKTVGYLFQNPDHQICCKTVWEEIAFGLQIIGLSQKEVQSRTNQALEEFDLDKVREKHPYFLSKADRQKLAAASVIAMRPEILLVDEPTTGFDSYESNKFMQMLANLNKNGQTIIIITHEMELVSRYVPRTIVLNHGKILLDGATRNVFAQRELLSTTYVKPPEISELAYRLRSKGCPNVLSVDELLSLIEKSC